MNTKTKQYLLSALSCSLLLLPLVSSAAMLNPCQGAEQAGMPCTPVYGVLIALMNFLLMILTVLAVIGFIISGIIYITAGGAGKADTARHWLTYSIIGVIVGLSGYIIIRLIDSLLRGRVDM